MVFLCVFLGVIWLCGSALFWSGKGLDLLRSWQMMTEEEKATVHEVRLTRSLGALLFALGILFIGAAVSPLFRISIFPLGMLAWMVICAAMAYSLSKTVLFRR